MANTVTSVLEIEEAGVLLRAEGNHVVRVLGARLQEHIIRLPPAKEDLWPAPRLRGNERVYAGELGLPEAGADAPPDAPQVPQFYLTDAGDAVTFQRNVTT